MLPTTCLVTKHYLAVVCESDPRLSLTKNIVRHAVRTPAIIAGTALVISSGLKEDLKKTHHAVN